MNDDTTFAIQIPALVPGTVQYEVEAGDNNALQSAFRRVELAQDHGSRADLQAAQRTFERVRERAYTAAFIRLRRSRASLRPSGSGPRRPRCRARRARPRAHRRRGGGRGGGSDDGGSGDPDPPPVDPASDAEVGHG